MKYLKESFLFIVCSLCFFIASAQVVSNINIDALSDQQLVQFVQSNGLSGLSETELTAKAKERGLTDEQISKLKVRLQTLNPQQGSSSFTATKEQGSDKKATQYIFAKPTPDSINGLVIYGSEIFTKENLSFEPNLNIPTPSNYVIGFGDELKIDVFGFSDKVQTLKVTPEGIIRYPNIGPIRVAGLTIEEVKDRIVKTLVKVYPSLQTGTTSLQISLAQIRSIHINLIGEISKPGTYTLPSLATIANALYASGGPTKVGSYRNIELIRDGKAISKFDFYDYLLKGDLRANKLLQDGDVIKVSPYSIRVELRGAVKRPAIYELASNDPLASVITYAGGLADDANKQFIRVARFGNRDKEMFTVVASAYNTFKPQSGDRISVDTVSNIFHNRVQVKGAIFFPGTYSTDDVPTLKDLLTLAKPGEDAYRERAIIRRLKEDYTAEIVDFNLDDVVNGRFNLKLRREDSVHIYPYKDIREPFTIEIRGEVNKPGTFQYADGMQVQDLILMGGGYRESASAKVVEVARRIKDSLATEESINYAIVETVDLSKVTLNNRSNTKLNPFDIVTIRRSPVYKEQSNVSIEGEVLYPGNYIISNNKERLSDIIKRAGGVKKDAYVEGAYLLRKTFENLSVNDSVLLKNKIGTLKKSVESTASTSNETKNIDDTIKVKQQAEVFKEDMKMVGIQLMSAVDKPGSVYDILLQEGDILKVPARLETVQTFNGVYFPKKIVYRPGLTLKQIVDESGGVLPQAKQSKAYVVYPNGEVKSARKFLFFTNYPNIKPGTEIYIPMRKEKKGFSIAEATAVAAGLGTLTTIIFTLRSL